MRLNRSVLLVLPLLLAFSLRAEEKKKDAPKLPDVTWTVQIKPVAANKLKGTTQPYNDVITIKDGKFSTQINDKYGFEPVAVTTKTEGGKTTLTAELKEEKHGSNLYTIEVNGGNVTGTMKWSKMGEDGKPKTADYTLTGSRTK